MTLLLESDILTVFCLLSDSFIKVLDSVNFLYIFPVYRKNRTCFFKLKFGSESLWESEKIHWILVNLAPLKKLSGAILTETQWIFIDSQRLSLILECTATSKLYIVFFTSYQKYELQWSWWGIRAGLFVLVLGSMSRLVSSPAKILILACRRAAAVRSLAFEFHSQNPLSCCNE